MTTGLETKNSIDGSSSDTLPDPDYVGSSGVTECSSVQHFRDGGGEVIDRKADRQEIFRLALPALGENLLISLIMVVDTAVVGRLGSEALAASGLAWTILFFFMMQFFALGTGTVAVVARYAGAGEEPKARKAAGQAVLLYLGLSTAVTLIVMIFAERFFALMGAEPAVQSLGSMYLRILASTFIFDSLLMVSNAALRATGNTKTPMKIVGMMNVSNAILDIILVFGIFNWPGMGLMGAAIATAFVRLPACILSFGGLITGRYNFRISWSDILPGDKEMIKRIFNVSWPAMIDHFLYAGALMVFSKIVTGLGTVSLAVHNVLIISESFAFMPGCAFATAAAIATGQSLGEGNPGKAHRLGWEAAKLGMYVMGIVGVIFFVIPYSVVRLFTHCPDVVLIAGGVLRAIAPIEAIQGLMFVMRGILQGAGDTKTTMKISGFGIWLLRIPFAYLFAVILGVGILGAWGAMCIHIGVTAILYLRRFRSGKWAAVKV